MEDFVGEHVTSAREREFLGDVVDAATAARSDGKTRVPARSFVRGAADGYRIDETEMFIAATRGAEAAHARFLAAAYSLFKQGNRDSADSQIVLNEDPKIGPAAAVLWRDLRDHGFLGEVDTNSRYETHAFRMTDLGLAVSWWLQDLGVALDRPAPA